jgi:tRNA threonylcarbamoyladenosine biosynthesis protein TsaB
MRALLSIDTAHGRCSAALLKSGQVAEFRESTMHSKQAEDLLPLITLLLAEQEIGFPELSHVAVCIGPGSFTGVRIGLAAAQGLCFGKNLPLSGVTALDAIHSRYMEEKGAQPRHLVAIHAQRGQAYVQAFTEKGAKEAPALIELADLESYAAAGGTATIIGNCPGMGIPIFYDARNIALAAHDKLEKGIPLAQALPLYIREPDAKLPKAG